MIPFFEYNLSANTSEIQKSRILISKDTLVLLEWNAENKLQHLRDYRGIPNIEEALKKLKQLSPSLSNNLKEIIWLPQFSTLVPSDQFLTQKQDFFQIVFGNSQGFENFDSPIKGQECTCIYLMPENISKLLYLEFPDATISPIHGQVIKYLAKQVQDDNNVLFGVILGKSLFMTGIKKGKIQFQNIFPIGDVSSLAYFSLAGKQLFFDKAESITFAGQLPNDKEWIDQLNKLIPQHDFDLGLIESLSNLDKNPELAGHYAFMSL